MESAATLLPGLTPKLIRILADNPWEGGGGYTYKEIGGMTLDQIYNRVIDPKLLRTAMMTKAAVEFPIGSEIKGKAADGTPISAIIRGKSVARELNERAAERRLKERQQKRKQKKKRKA